MHFSGAVALAFSILGFVFSIVSTFTPAWVNVSIRNESFQLGHILGCGFINKTHNCLEQTKYLLNDDEERASFAFMNFSVVFLLFSAIFFLIGLKGSKTEYVSIGGLLSVAGGISAFIAVVVFIAFYARNNNPENYVSFGYSFALAWVAVFCGFFAAGLGIVHLYHDYPGGLWFMKVRRTRINTVSSSNDFAC